MAEKKPNKIVWYILAIIFGIIGGAVGYFSLRKVDKKLARNVLIVGIVITILYYVLIYLYTVGLYVQKTAV